MTLERTSPDRIIPSIRLQNSKEHEVEEFKFSIQQLDEESSGEEQKSKEKEKKLESMIFKRRINREKSVKLPNINIGFGSLDDMDISGPGRNNVSDLDINDNLSEYHSLMEEDYKHFDQDYFIHDYSENTEEGSLISCPARIGSAGYSIIHPDPAIMSEKDIMYYENIDDEGIIGMQNALVGDYYRENPELVRIRNRVTFRKLVIENDFLLRIFPINKQEKPGRDFYNYGVVFQFLIVLYLLFFFSQMTGEKEELSETFKFKRFRTEMIFFIFIQIMLILLDRFFYISNTFDQLEKEESDIEEPKSVFQNVMKNENKHNFIKLMVYLALVILVHI